MQDSSSQGEVFKNGGYNHRTATTGTQLTQLVRIPSVMTPIRAFNMGPADFSEISVKDTSFNGVDNVPILRTIIRCDLTAETFRKNFFFEKALGDN